MDKDTPLISFGGTTMPSGGLFMSSTVVGVETPLPLATAAAISTCYSDEKEIKDGLLSVDRRMLSWGWSH